MDSLINEYFAAQSTTQQKGIARAIAEKLRPLGVLTLVQSLQTQLTGPDEKTRADATECLARVLKHLPVQSDQKPVLWSFFCDRLTDGESFVPAIHGLSAIDYTSDLDQLRKSFEEAKFRSQPQKSRHEAFLYIRRLVSSKINVFDLFIDLASGEKDPQNLLVSLEISKLFLDNGELTSNQKEEIFDITFCYFPVTFKPPKDMHYKIDVDDIRSLLRETICSPVIAELVVPALISKLAALNPDIKADVLRTINQAVRTYPDEILHAYWLQLWDGLKYEILHGSPENQFNSAVFEILQRLADIPDFVDQIAGDVAQIDPTKKALAIQICILIVGVANSQHLFNRLAEPALDTLFIEHQVGNIEFVNILLTSRYNIPSHRDDILSLLMSGLGSPDYYKVAVTGMAPLALHVPEFAPLLVQGLTQHIPNDSAISAISDIAKIDSSAVNNGCLTVLFTRITPEYEPATKEALEVLSKICVTKELIHTLTIRLVSRADTVEDQKYLFDILSCLLTAIQTMDLQNLSRYYKYIFPILRNFFTPSPRAIFLNDIIINCISSIMLITVRAIPESNQAEYAEEICRLIWPENSCVFGQSPSPLSFLVTSCLAGVKDSNLPSRFQISFVQYTDILRRTNKVFERTGYLRYLAVGVNKWPLRFGDIPLALKWLRTSIETGQDAISNLEVLCWIAKGLLLRTDKLGYEVARYVGSLLVNPQLGMFASKVYGVLVMDDRLLSKENGIIVRNLYKQRLFLQELPHLLEGYKSSHGDAKLNFMMALNSQIRYTPTNILQQNLEQVMPVILECLEPNVPPLLQQGSLQTIASTLTQPGATGLYEKSIDPIINSCLALCIDSQDATVRRLAIEVIYLMTIHMPRSTVKMYAPVALRRLPAALSDGRREVRREASKCIQSFHVL